VTAGRGGSPDLFRASTHTALATRAKGGSLFLPLGLQSHYGMVVSLSQGCGDISDSGTVKDAPLFTVGWGGCLAAAWWGDLGSTIPLLT
jgi:hypothetical protein